METLCAGFPNLHHYGLTTHGRPTDIVRGSFVLREFWRWFARRQTGASDHERMHGRRGVSDGLKVSDFFGPCRGCSGFVTRSRNDTCHCGRIFAHVPCRQGEGTGYESAGRFHVDGRAVEAQAARGLEGVGRDGDSASATIGGVIPVSAADLIEAIPRTGDIYLILPVTITAAGQVPVSPQQGAENGRLPQNSRVPVMEAGR